MIEYLAKIKNSNFKLRASLILICYNTYAKIKRRKQMTYKILLLTTTIVATILGVLSFSELAENSGIIYIGIWTFSVLAIYEGSRRLIKGDE